MYRQSSSIAKDLTVGHLKKDTLRDEVLRRINNRLCGELERSHQ